MKSRPHKTKLVKEEPLETFVRAIKRRMSRERGVVVAITARIGMKKDHAALNLGCRLDPHFDVGRVILDIEHALAVMEALPKGSWILLPNVDASSPWFMTSELWSKMIGIMTWRRLGVMMTSHRPRGIPTDFRPFVSILVLIWRRNKRDLRAATYEAKIKENALVLQMRSEIRVKDPPKGIVKDYGRKMEAHLEHLAKEQRQQEKEES